MTLTYRDLDLMPFDTERAIAVGVSGGPDSLALAWLLKEWASEKGVALHILSVDHGLRDSSAEEARMVGALVKGWPNVTHQILTWEGDKPETRIAEAARAARYDLMEQYCRDQGIRFLFLAHHQDDQAETFLFRLAKGSGLDGLSAMQAVQVRGDIMLVRPLLHVSKADLIAVCTDNHLPYVQDPTNENTAYARPRLRAAKTVLEEEGLSAKRLTVTAGRLARARHALEHIAQENYGRVLKEHSGDAIAFDVQILCDLPEEIILRLIQRAMGQVSASQDDYPARLEKVERLAGMIAARRLDKTTSLGGCLFVPDAKNGLLWVKKEF